MPRSVFATRVDPESGAPLEEDCEPSWGDAYRELFLRGTTPAPVCPESGHGFWSIFRSPGWSDDDREDAVRRAEREREKAEKRARKEWERAEKQRRKAEERAERERRKAERRQRQQLDREGFAASKFGRGERRGSDCRQDLPVRGERPRQSQSWVRRRYSSEFVVCV